MEPIDEIRQKIDIVALISEYVALKKLGRNFKARCPFHNEKTPSFVVSPERQIWRCFGCGVGGDAFEFIEKIENVDFVEALKILAQKTGVKLTNFHFDDNLSKKKERLYQLNGLASEYYHYVLTKHQSGKKALKYILERGISEKSLKTFMIGYAPNAWEGVSKFLVKKGFKPSELSEAGLVILDQSGRSYYDRFRGRLIFTLKDHRGNVVGFAGRILPSENLQDDKEARLRSASQNYDGQAKYINSPETPVYIKGNVLYGLDVNRESIRMEKQAIVVEGEIDCISSFQSGASNVVAIKGTALTEGQLNLLKRFTDTLLIALDADLAGDAAARRGIETAEKMGFTMKVVKVLFGKDPNECIQKDPQLWKESLSSAVPIYDFYINSALSKYNPEEAEGKKRITREVLPILATLDNLVVREHYLKLLAQKIQTTMDVLLAEMEKLVKEEKTNFFTTKIKEEETKISRPRREILEEYFISAILQSTKPEKQLERIKEALKYCKTEKLVTVLKLLLENFNVYSKWDYKIFAQKIPSELVDTTDRLYLMDLHLDQETFETELEETIREMAILSLKEDLQNISLEMRKTEDRDKLEQLNRDFEELALKIKKLGQ